MKIKMISPGWSKTSIWGHIWFKFPVLSLPALAAVTPEEHSITYFDDNIENVLAVGDEDLVAISVMTPLARRAYEIADFFRNRGKKVVLGGVHTTFCAEEAAEHADALVIGEGERSWPLLLEDFQKGVMKKRYSAPELIAPEQIPPARRSILEKKGYFFTNLIQTTRGCPFDCEFCSVTSLYGGSYRVRPLEQVESELRGLAKPGSFVFIVDDNIIGRPRYTAELCDTISPFRFKWLSHASINLAFQDELLHAVARSGCHGLFVGFETLNEENLSIMGKKVNRVEYYDEAIKRFHDAGIGILGSFVVGYDFDDLDTFDAIYEFCLKTKLDGGLFTILTPFPGTRVRDRMESEGRLLTSDWTYYDMEHVVYQPRKLSVDQLYQSFEDLTRDFHSMKSIFSRLFPPKRHFQFFGPSNFGFRSAWKKCLRAKRKGDKNGP